MKSPRLQLLSLAILFTTAVTPHGISAEVPSKSGLSARLVITNGMLEDQKPATLRNIVDFLSEFYPNKNIAMIGVDQVKIENLILQCGRRANLGQPMVWISAEGALTALVEASGHKFRIRGFGPDAFILSRPDGGPGMHHATEVFNLGMMKQSRTRAALEEDIRRAETEIAVLRVDYGDKHPRVVEGITRINILKAQLPPASPARDVELLEKIEDVVNVSLKLKSGGEPPQFRFHAATNLLVVVGSEDAIDITRKVIAALEKNPLAQEL